MSHNMPDSTPPADAPVEPQGSKIGTDEWVSQVEQRRKGHTGIWGAFLNRWEMIDLKWRYAIVLLFFIVAPLITNTQIFLDAAGITNNDFLVRIGARFLVFAMLAIGLNVVVGYAGLLDLGYVAFYGIAGYLYAYMSSDFVQIEGFIPYGLAVPSLLSIPLIILIVALVGWILGFVSLRLVGDYLAIVTLGFGQVFVQLAKTATRVKVPGVEGTVDFTRGPNGINNLDNISIFGFTFDSTVEYYFLFLVLVILLYIAVDNINSSRIGRAWRAIREDELAAEVMGTPTRRMKLLAFAIGAGIAALAGAVDAAWQTNVVPEPRYSVITLINLYAMVVLGGIGSLPGVVIGAFIFTVLPEALRSVALASVLFYAGLLLSLYNYLRPWRRFLIILGGTILGGYIFKLLINLVAPGIDAGFPPPGSLLNQIVQGWLVIPANYTLVGNFVTVLAVLVLLIMVITKNPLWKTVLLGVAIYMFAFAWETRLAVEPAATRILIVGASLVMLMIFRPQGLLGKAEVKVV